VHSPTETGRAPNGTLILIVGPSGAGKDTLLDAARRSFKDDERLLFCDRVITRAHQIGEKHIVISEAEFERKRNEGGFFLFWCAHDLQYGIVSDILDVLKAGRSVIVNVSRQIVSEARAKWPSTRVIHITAGKDVRRERLIARGRESIDGINERIGRADSLETLDAEWLSRLDNSGALADGVERFVEMIADAISSEARSAQES
jgi:ribose 1,5-bisphosphokinase